MVQFALDVIEDIKNNGPANTLEEIAEAGRKAYCNLYQNNPGWVLMKNNLVLPIVKRTLDKICAEPGFTAPIFEKDVPFTGMQCCDKTYRYLFEWSYQFCDGNIRTFDPLNQSAGKVIGPFIRVKPDDPNRTEVGIEYERCDGSRGFLVNENRPEQLINSASCPSPGSSSASGFIKEDSFTFTLISSQVIAGGGSVDDCGNLPGSYPTYPPITDVTEVTQDIDVTNNAGDTYTYDVVVNFDSDLEIKMPVSINVNQTNVTIGIDGINVGDNKPDAPSQGDDDDSVTTYLPQPVSSPAVETVEEPATEEEEDAEGLVAIKVNIASVPANASSVQSGVNLTKIYAGWVIFKEGNYHHPRQFIDFKENIFYAPDNANGYIVYLKPGYTGTVTKVVESQN